MSPLPIPPQVLAVLIISIKDLIIELTKPEEEIPEEWKAKIEADLQTAADEGEEWLKKTLAELRDTS